MGSHTWAYPWGDAAATCESANFTPYQGLPCVGDTSAADSNPAGASPVSSTWTWRAMCEEKVRHRLVGHQLLQRISG